MKLFRDDTIKIERHDKIKVNGIPINRVWKHINNAWVFMGYFGGFSFNDAYEKFCECEENQD